MPKKTYNVLNDFSMGEVSAVKMPAQEGAVAVIMKSKDPELLAKLSFTEALAAMKLEESFSEAFRDLYEVNQALRRSVKASLADPSVTDKQTAIRQIIEQYKAQIDAMVQRAVSTASGQPLAIQREALKAAVNSMADSSQEGDMNDKVEKGEDNKGEDLSVLKAQVERLTKVNALPADHRAHFDTLDKAKQDLFLQMTDDARKHEVTKAKAAAEQGDQVVFVAKSGKVFRASDDPEVVKAFKEREELEGKVEKLSGDVADINKQLEDQKLTKQAEDTLGHLPGTIETKKAMLKAVNAIEDKTQREEALKALTAGDKAIKAAFDSVGSEDPTITKARADAKGEFAKKVDEAMAANDKLTKSKAMEKVARENPDLHAKAFNNRQN